eukprot:c27030_g2_i1 orf=978-2936(+)
MSTDIQVRESMFKAEAFIFSLLLACCMGCGAQSSSQGLASTPPRGWNSYDSFSWIISEGEFLANAALVAEQLLPYGYEYVVIDFLWYRQRLPGASVTSPGFDVLDEWGRPIPDPGRWPSSAGGNGFKLVSEQVHAMGLKFGIHVMRGISTEAVKKNLPILGAPGWRAADIVLQNEACSWMPACFVSVNESTEGGRAFIQSLYDLYASWEVDFVKHDCVFGINDLSVHEIKATSQAIAATGRPMVYSISPGVLATPAMAKLISGFVNMFRITSDDWDSWNDVQLHFNVARDFAAAGLIGGEGLNGYSWPDLDMLPLGYLTDPGVNEGPHRFCQLTPTEQRTQVTLWAMAKSPLIFGGDMLHLDQATLDLLTNPAVLNINANSYGNKEIQGTTLRKEIQPVLSVVECKDANSTRWSIESSSLGNRDQICWAFSSGTKGNLQVPAAPMGCLNWSPHVTTSTNIDEIQTIKAEKDDQTTHLGHGCLWTPSNEKMCLDPQKYRSSSFESFQSMHMAPFSLHGSQLWRLNHEGKLISESTQLCATMSPLVVGMDEDDSGGLQFPGARIWTARGMSGEYYVAFFNFGSESAAISVPLATMIQSSSASPHDISDYGRSWVNYQCSGQDAWSSKDIGVVGQNLSVEVDTHGCALFSLNCDQ